ncbi:hypothetical protein HY949_01290 [Candidatus Gottesmanbacteria bacterium]|nr:hypothetical protein [Candidatus Gottesmanbacteria bacterium]
MKTTLTSPLTLLKQAWSLALSRQNIISFLILGAVPQLLFFAFSALIALASGTTDFETTISDLFTNSGGWGIVGLVLAGLIGLVIISLISAWYTALLYTVYQATAAGTIEKLTTYVRPAKAVTVHVLVTYMTVGLFTSLGFLLFIIPGIIIAVRYMFAPMIAAVEDRTTKPIDESKRLVKGRFWKLAGRGLLMIVCYNIPLSIFQAIHPVLGSAWAVTSPIFGLYFFLVYRDFKNTALVTT